MSGRRHLFSDRYDMAEQAKAWCLSKGIPINAFNIVTALFQLGLVKDQQLEEISEAEHTARRRNIGDPR
jgi:predicted RNase H-like nuclease